MRLNVYIVGLIEAMRLKKCRNIEYVVLLNFIKYSNNKILQ